MNRPEMTLFLFIGIVLVLVVFLVSSGGVSQKEDSSVEKIDDNLTVNSDMNTEPLENTQENITTVNSWSVDKVEVLHFHGEYQCISCINVGKCAEEAVSDFFSDEQNSGVVYFAHVNGELSENAALVQKYEATGSSLWIGVYNKDGSFSKEQNINVWYKTSNMGKCKEYIKGVIGAKLTGGG